MQGADQGLASCLMKGVQDRHCQHQYDCCPMSGAVGIFSGLP